MDFEDAALYVNDLEIDGRVISETPAKDVDALLSDIGITSPCQRIRFKILFKRKQQDFISREAKICSPPELVYFCKTTKGLSEVGTVRYYGLIIIDVFSLTFF